ncbi:MAG TPA: DUF2213 domain-containing protein [Bosea sp. (in: a-proteobacteria)]|jgi:hypothetical protein|uniref:DUF2213 domain-containing protein n=1 Tax=Bosea sp. (in: a-proteobacteria) TaxID=1871050 RepID=UPI002E11B117|nr:DUF2213 domain-containing protein [Bosea sp. (in: a-proteobacteria)]
MLFTDKIALSGTRRTGDGYLVADARVARTGIQIYLGREVGRPDMEQVRVYRAPEQVFADEAMASFAHRPVTNDHPSEAVNAKNWKRYSVGQTGDEVKQDGKFLRIPMVVMDQAAIDDIEAGKSELSNGYGCDLDWTPGTTPEGEAYDAMQIRIRGNHVAIVKAGRAGPECRIGDSWAAITTEQKDAPMSLKTVTVDGIPVEVTDQGATVINTLLGRIADAGKAKDTLVADHEKALATKDADLAKKDAEIDALKAKVLDDAALDARVQARGDLVAKAKAIAPEVATDGKSDADIRRAVVTAKLGDAAVKDKPTAYIDARFDILAEDVKPSDPVRGVIKDGPAPTAKTSVTDAHTAMVTGLQDAWKTPTKGAA